MFRYCMHRVILIVGIFLFFIHLSHANSLFRFNVKEEFDVVCLCEVSCGFFFCIWFNRSRLMRSKIPQIYLFRRTISWPLVIFQLCVIYNFSLFRMFFFLLLLVFKCVDRISASLKMLIKGVSHQLPHQLAIKIIRSWGCILISYLSLELHSS